MLQCFKKFKGWENREDEKRFRFLKISKPLKGCNRRLIAEYYYKRV